MKTHLNYQDLENLQISQKQNWGPDPNYKFPRFENMAFAPFSRLEKLGKCCDFANMMAVRTGQKQIQSSNMPQLQQQQNNQQQQQQVPLPEIPQEEEQYSNSYVKQPSRQRQKINPNKTKIVVIRTKFKDSSNIQANWVLLTESQKINIEQHPIKEVKFTELECTGTLKKYNRSYDKIDPRYIKKVECNQTVILPSASSLKDPVLIRLLEEDLENKIQKPTVYTTDALLLALMTLKKGEFPWDIYVQKDGNQIILDKYEADKYEGNNKLFDYMEYQTVNENGNILPEEERELNKLCIEATTVTRQFQYQTTQGETELWEISEGKENQVENMENENVAFKYINCNIDDKIDIKVRVQIDAFDYVKEYDPENNDVVSEQKVPILIRTINEYDHSNQWKNKLLTQKGTVTGGEYINNCCNYIKWLIQMEMTGAKMLKLGFTSRVSSKDNTTHDILCVDSFTFEDLFKNIQFRSLDQWQVVKYFIDFICKQPDGNYMFVKGAFKQSIRTYELPQEDVQEEQENDEEINL
ncbi:hypothetical protein IMG5_161490 [Ichthyophthirius multifiliis]|uniref:Uncharacterized protein n=1 Tax=Ichthyophthirius multifiliis TaxID=5932 RepID=G0R032_ICHMU|nr:hypothetical protein IMG5_161490 [Ichthyophthirius multifiliis]EGR29172.1 hypothetical protein IMG5_161490 [Ichthyophthirius multifiliis]|eukprot:XP_004030408.1 hypothetical protein IMG5_161490 [Ichthyophthirius multifiliis]